MAVFSHYQLHKALFARLSADNTLTGMVDGIYDHVPQDGAYPYITLGEIQTTDWSNKTTSGTENNFSIRCWSREGGRKQNELIMERIHTLLHDADFAVEGQHLVLLRFVSSSIQLLADGWTYRGNMLFRALLESTGS